ncbi:M48 family metallopeptidase [Ruegeria litorea]|uniref:M48 family metallopeptidase n=1 Tax=Falsiruegeria litorea TaxID=1280831 RepID=A0ABS5WKC0_9RHOB|nr:M48 family metallopeptidase [Falsiruegeria litorea]MBT3139569.1 M48 family metallopeptidase [Falsiruegeria litorea]
MHRLILLIAGLVSACAPVPLTRQPSDIVPGSRVDVAIRSFTEVSQTIGPRAVQACRARAKKVNCDFRIGVDPDPRAQANAYQSVDDQGRPVITFTAAMILEAGNKDELAFVMSHEAAHHILGHLDRQAENAARGADEFVKLARRTGNTSKRELEYAKKLGAAVGAVEYSKEFELEADELGTVIAYGAGHDPLAGANFFARLPDPGDKFFGSHPPNQERIALVQATVTKLTRAQ